MKNTIRGAASAALLTVLLAGSGAAASAIPEPGPPSGSHVPDEQENCPLERIGTQLVRCDNLTGAGVQAPWQVPAQRSR